MGDRICNAKVRMTAWDTGTVNGFTNDSCRGLGNNRILFVTTRETLSSGIYQR